MAHIGAIVPVYRGEECMEELYTRLSMALRTVSEDYEIILVEDCGGDHSWEMIQDLCKKDSKVKGLQFSRNFGQHSGITAGLDHCDSDWIVVMDGDLQDRPEEIPLLYKKAQEGYDVVLAQRADRKDSFLKVLSSKLYYKLFNFLSGMNYDGSVANFRIISRRVVEAIRPMREHLRFFGGLVQWVGFPTASIQVQHDPRFAGESTYTLSKMMNLAISTTVAYSNKPLRLCIGFGFLISLFSFLFGLYQIVKKVVWGLPVMGWTSLIVSIYFLGGIVIFILGLLGLYLGKMFDETKKRPLYIVAERRNFQKIESDQSDS